MGIYLPNMEMPTSCLECRLFSDPWCMAKNRIQWRTAYNRPPNGERQNDCPLVPVLPHGRLIDADALCELCDIMADKCDGIEESIWHQFRTTVEWTPTIIPAEEGEG